MSGDCTCKSQPTYPPDDTLTYVWTAKDEKDDNVTNDVFVDEKGESLGDKTSGENLSRIRFKAKKAGTYYMTVTVDDGREEGLTKSTVITVGCINHPPVFDPDNKITVIPDPPYRVGQKIDLVSVATDPDGDSLTYKWLVKNNKDNHEIQNLPEKSIVNFSPEQAGIYSVTVTVDDGKGEEIDAPIDIDVVKPIFNTSENLILI